MALDGLDQMVLKVRLVELVIQVRLVLTLYKLRRSSDSDVSDDRLTDVQVED